MKTKPLVQFDGFNAVKESNLIAISTQFLVSNPPKRIKHLHRWYAEALRVLANEIEEIGNRSNELKNRTTSTISIKRSK